MKITIKPTRQEPFQVEVEPSQTIAELKAQINNSKDIATESQRFVFSGRAVSDSETFETLDIKDGGHLVLMISNPKPQPETQTSLDSSPTASHASASGGWSGDAISFLQRDNVLGRGLPEMSTGNARDEGIRPMQSISNHTANFLANRHQAPMIGQPSTSRLTAPTFSQRQDTLSVSRPLFGQTLNPVRSPPIFHGVPRASFGAQRNEEDCRSALRQRLREDPQFRQDMIQRLAEGNPECGRLLSENPEALDAALQNVIVMSADDMESVRSLEELGITHLQAVEAYLACSKDIDLAANYLLNHQMSDAPPVPDAPSFSAMVPRPSKPTTSTHIPQVSRVTPAPLTTLNDDYPIVDDSRQQPPPSNALKMTSQAATSLGIALQNSLSSVHDMDVSKTVPSTPTSEKGKAKENLTSVNPTSTGLAPTANMSPLTMDLIPSMAGHFASTIPKAVATATDIRRLEGNHSMLAKRVETLDKQFGEQITDVSDRVRSLTQDVATLSSSIVGNKKMEELISSFVSANNDSVALVKRLQEIVDRDDAALTQLSSRVEGMQHAIDALHSTIDRLSREESQCPRRRPSFSEEAPPSKRCKISPDVSPQPPYANASVHCSAMFSTNDSGAPAPNPSELLKSLQTPVEGLEYSLIPSTDLEVGPVEWGQDINQEFRNLIMTLQNHSDIEPQSYTAVSRTREHYIRVRCESPDDAYKFLTRWQEGPRSPQMDHVSVNYIVAVPSQGLSGCEQD
ncbi:unnamed protein product [Cyclocybe aegerita]|uniref:Ubiquitin-like domain-containing protein n=1 Tax=Cyclocybe aegerita TaxID=1973307 RepID=A0A8S0WAH2_CYCAE|nr:unnamed protein product [Cyclocybe aegerita]